MSLGILSDPTLPLPILLDTVRHSETGHLSLDQARKPAAGQAQSVLTSSSSVSCLNLATGCRQTSRSLTSKTQIEPGNSPVNTSPATRYTTTSPRRCRSWSPTTCGPFGSCWIARGENIDELPLETQQYITRAAEYLTKNQQPNTEEPQMANDTLLGLPFDGTSSRPVAAWRRGQSDGRCRSWNKWQTRK